VIQNPADSYVIKRSRKVRLLGRPLPTPASYSPAMKWPSDVASFHEGNHFWRVQDSTQAINRPVHGPLVKRNVAYREVQNIGRNATFNHPNFPVWSILRYLHIWIICKYFTQNLKRGTFSRGRGSEFREVWHVSLNAMP